MTAYELGVTFRLATRVGHGEHQAWIVTAGPIECGYRFVELLTDIPCAPGMTFALDGALWRVDRELHGAGEGMWSAEPVPQ